MIEFEGLNYWAIALAWFVNVAVGAFWYSPSGFGKQWSKHTGVNIMKIPENEATKIIGFVALSAVLQAFTLGVILNSLGASTIAEGLQVGLILWLGLVAATTVGNTLYQRLGWKFWWLNNSYFLLVTVVNSIILTAWQ